MTPPIPSSGSAAVAYPPSEDPQGTGAAGPQGSQPKPFEGSQVLNGILKKTGRVPTHPLTAQPPKPKAEVTAADAKKAEDFRKKGDEYIGKKNLKKALGYYQNAHKANPNDPKILLSLAKAEHLSGDLLRAHDHYNELLASDPGLLEVRALRGDAVQGILAHMQKIAPKIPKEKQQEFLLTGQMLTLELSMDRAALLAHGVDKEIEGLKQAEKELEKLHGKSKAEKEQICQRLLAMAMDAINLAQLPAANPKDAELIPEKLNLLTREIFAILARFAHADSDPALKRLAPLFLAYQRLGEGKTEDAIQAFEIVREEGFKSLGGGDAAKGEGILKDKLDKAAKAFAAKDGPAVEKIMSEIPPGLADAHAYLKTFESEKTRMMSLVAVAAWEEDVDAFYQKKARDADGFWDQPGVFWDTVWGNQSSQDKIAKEHRRDMNLVHAVRMRLATGKAATLEAALKNVEATETGELKGQATVALAKAAKGEDQGVLPLSKVLSFTAKPKMDKGSAEALMSTADLAGTFGGRPKLRTLMYYAVYSSSPDPVQKAKAGGELKKLNEK